MKTNPDGSNFTISAAASNIGPGGTWWNKGNSGLGIYGPLYVWPFCALKGGDDVRGSGSGSDLPIPQSSKETSEPKDDNYSKPQESQGTSAPSMITISGMTLSSSSSSSSTPSGQPCSPDCTTCNEYTTKFKKMMLGRGLTHLKLNTPGKSSSKHTLSTPADYGSDATMFLLSEYAYAEWLNVFSTNKRVSSGSAGSFRSGRYDAAVHGLVGCTSVVVASQAGMWVSHFWEEPSFRATQEYLGQTRTTQDIANYNEYALEQMQVGGPAIPGLRQFTAAGGESDVLQRTVWAIVTPWKFSEVTGSWGYEPDEDEVRAVLDKLFLAVPPLIIDYQPMLNQKDQINTTSGKILLQYDPFQAIIDKTLCNIYQQAMFRFRVEDRTMYVWQKFWAAEANQLITDFSNYILHHKLDNVPTCRII